MLGPLCSCVGNTPCAETTGFSPLDERGVSEQAPEKSVSAKGLRSFALIFFVMLRKPLKKTTEKAMKLAKKLEAKTVPSRKEIAQVYKKGMAEAKKLQQLLEPSWFVKDVHKKKSRKKPKKKVKKRK